MGRDAIMIGHETIDLRYVEQLVDSEQLNTLGQIVRFLEEEIFDGKKTLGQAVEQAEKLLDKRGPAGMCEGNIVPGNLARPRIQEIYACMNRYRKLGTPQEREGIEYESHCRECKKNTVKDVRRHGYQTDDRQDQGDIV